ncbi:MAG TPA: GerMN domain-containing protein [Longimicrobiales bacterium]
MPRPADVPVAALVLALAAVGACERADRERVAQEEEIVAHDSAVPATSREPSAAPGNPSDAAAADDADRTETTSALRAAIDRLVRGAAGDSATWFSGETADIVRNVHVDASGRAIVDFVDLRPIIPNASSSAGSEMLLAQLNATVFSVPGVLSVEYRMAGSCALLGEWLQYGTCLRYDRPQ